MRILVACEESQAVTIEMRNLGHEAFSCDIQECSGLQHNPYVTHWVQMPEGPREVGT